MIFALKGENGCKGVTHMVYMPPLYSPSCRMLKCGRGWHMQSFGLEEGDNSLGTCLVVQGTYEVRLEVYHVCKQLNL